MTGRMRRAVRWARGRGVARDVLRAFVAAAAALTALAQGPASAQTPAKELFGRATGPTDQAPEVVGGYARGCLAGAVQLAMDGAGGAWQAMRPSRDRRYGHPSMIAFIERLSAEAQEIGWPGVLVGDIAQARGGPMLTGHASHQTGIDADIWLRPAPAQPLSARAREELSAIPYVAPDRRSVIAEWTPEHHAVLRAAASDPAVARIFVNGAIKGALCERADRTGEDRAWLRQIRPWYGHDSHFHVRLHCPPGSPFCQPQDAPPPGDGCDEVAWWLSDEVLNPKPDPNAPPRPPRPPLSLADLPDACRAILDAAARAP